MNPDLQPEGLAARAFAERIAARQPHPPARARELARLCFAASADGHSCLHLPADAIDAFAGNPLVAQVHAPGQAAGPALLVQFGHCLYLEKHWRLENALFRQLQSRTAPHACPRSGDLPYDLAEACLTRALLLLTGGPGTGKTTTIARALPLWRDAFRQRQGREPRVLLCAPTGKAAARLNAAWPQAIAPIAEAQTLHRLLGIRPDGRHSRYHADHLLPADLLVLDEASMLDLPNLVRLLDALPSDCPLLLVGDPAQLPSIEIGSVLHSLLHLPPGSALQQGIAAAHFALGHNFRQADAPGLAGFSRDVMQQQPERVLASLRQSEYPGVHLLAASPRNLQAALSQMLDFASQLAVLPDAGQALARIGERVLLSPLRDGPTGCDPLNAWLAQHMQYRHGAHGQWLLVTRNDPGLGLANGDIGIVWRHPSGLKVHFARAGGTLVIERDLLTACAPAYALTVHKAQGSEYTHVDLLLPDTDTPLLTRALFYTAITRARRELRILGGEAYVRQALVRAPVRMHGLAALASA